MGVNSTNLNIPGVLGRDQPVAREAERGGVGCVGVGGVIRGRGDVGVLDKSLEVVLIVVGDVKGEGDGSGEDTRWDGAEGGERHAGLRSYGGVLRMVLSCEWARVVAV